MDCLNRLMGLKYYTSSSLGAAYFIYISSYPLTIVMSDPSKPFRSLHAASIKHEDSSGIFSQSESVG
jgi:hypothetical protein